MELSKYITGAPVEIERSKLRFADYNPRKITTEERKALKRGIKEYGMVGGLVVNRRTGFTVVSGHQRISVMDELQKYPEEDYKLRVDLIDVDEKQEKELNILLNNPNAQGQWDYDALRELISDIDYKSAGLTEQDLSLIGVDYLFKTEKETSLSDALEGLMAPVTEEREAEKELRRAERAAEMKAKKERIKEETSDTGADVEAYLMLSFSNFESKRLFCEKFSLDPYSKFLKGEDFDSTIESIIEG